MDKSVSFKYEREIRFALIVYAGLLYAAGFAYFIQLPLALDLWPLNYTNTMSFIFIASIFAAAASPLLWAALTREYAAIFGVALDAVIVLAPVTIYALQLGGTKMRAFAGLSAALTLLGLLTIAYFRRFAFRNQQPTPRPVRVAFGLFAMALLGFGGAMALKNRGILSWQVTTEATVLYGWAFLGAFVYFVYGLLVPKWGNAVGQLLGFLAYDVVLIVPFILHFSRVPSDLLLNHIIYTGIVIFSGVLAVYYLGINPQTRIWRTAHQPAQDMETATHDADQTLPGTAG